MNTQINKTIIALATAVALTFSANASAGEAKRVNNIVEYSEGLFSNNVNSVSVGRTAEGFVVQDLTSNVNVGQGCSRVNQHKAICGSSTPSKVKMRLEGGNDVAGILSGALHVSLDIDAGNGNDILLGGDRNDTLQGGAGNDDIDGGKGNDNINGGAGNDEITGGSDKDTIDGDLGKDDINGGSGDDTLKGGLGDDSLNGGAGQDKIIGDLGNDNITGGSGKDDIDAGLGKDKLFVDDGEKDKVECGVFDLDIDRVDTDPNFLDTLKNCEDSFVD